jgi:ABC-type Mn2+/Zn2+ transport system permease subunit
MNWWDDALHRATAEVLLVGALAGLIGVQVVLRRLSFFTMALTHATFPGVVAASIIGINIFVGGVLAGTIVALGVAALSRRRGQNAAAATGVMISAGFALGAGLVATQSGFSRDLSSFLVGSILTVSVQDLVMTAIVLVVVSLVLLVCARPLLLTGFDRAGAQAAGYATGAWDVVLLLTIEVVVVTIVPAVGTILALALIVAPAAAARLWSTRLPVITTLAVVFGAISGLAGLYASSRWNLAAGASITLAATAIRMLSTLLSRLRRATVPATGAAPTSAPEITAARMSKRPPGARLPGALTDGDITPAYYVGFRAEYDLTPGAAYRYTAGGRHHRHRSAGRGGPPVDGDLRRPVGPGDRRTPGVHGHVHRLRAARCSRTSDPHGGLPADRPTRTALVFDMTFVTVIAGGPAASLAWRHIVESSGGSRVSRADHSASMAPVMRDRR